jgi:cytochrome c2
VLLAPAAACLGAGGETRWDLPVGDPGQGREAFRALGCATCHRLNREGSGPAPDLVANAGRAYGPLELAGGLWTRGPRMWAAQARSSARLPAVRPGDMAGIFAYLFTLRGLGAAGDPGKGRTIARELGCASCHAGGRGQRSGVKAPIDGWPLDPFELTGRFWSHRQSAAGREHPGLGFGAVFDIMAWVSRARRAPPALTPPADVPLPAGKETFRAKGCAECHRGTFSFERRRTRFGVVEIAFAAWNHPPGRGEPLNGLDVRTIAGYVAALQFDEETGDRERGAAVFERKKCGACHEGGTGPELARFRDGFTSYSMAAALWAHGPAMLAEMSRRGASWPEFRASEMADLIAFLHGARLRTRPEISLREPSSRRGKKMAQPTP